MNLENLCKEVIRISQDVGEFIVSSRSEVMSDDIIVKGKHNFVTFVDKESEKRIIQGLQKLIPESGFIAEEGTVTQQNKEYIWIIDPLDGTTNFLHGLAPFCVSIGLKHHDKLILGVIHEPNYKETFYAWQGSSAFLNGNEINVSNTKNLDDSLLATGFPYTEYDQMDNYMELFKWCMRNTRGLRRLGSAAMDLAYVACGRMDGFFEYGLSPWDVAAGAFIVQQAGGKVSDFDGGNDYLFGKELVAFNPYLQQAFVEKTIHFMKK